ncbi:unnamed protein product [Candida verbasci]|uniref:Chitin synthase n=1 Tax=Candida verbasci TaxID=1227364 RepID=A0A9W4XDI9_9ASCO|nr:unnamed protein product [Candida verbasci]
MSSFNNISDDEDDLFNDSNTLNHNPFNTLNTPFHFRNVTNSSYSTIVDDYNENIKYPTRSKTVNFKDDIEYPPIIYSPGKQNSYPSYYEDELYNDNGSYYNGENYIINPLEDAEVNEEDPFNDSSSLFSDTGEDIIRRRTTIKKLDNDSDDDFQPQLTYSKTIKKAKLINGNYIIDAPIPRALLNMYGKQIENMGQEMSFLRYTGATCGPSNFTKFGYNLRQGIYEPNRQTEIMVCITMYNEDEIFLAKTLKGVFDNIKDLTNRNDPKWGDDSWKKIVVCIINDGRLELNKRTEILLSSLGIFQEGYAKSKINDKSVKAHIYEYTSTVGIDSINEQVYLTSNSTPVQFIFCLKEKNQRKINSHRWCFQAFGPILNPKIIMLLDCGTKPSKNAFYHLWRSFKDPNVAGACGEMKVSLGENKRLLSNPLVAAQNFEYKISNILDKPMESVFGFISVLPGAFSAYRYEALLNVNGVGPLEKYFKGEYLHQDQIIDEDDDEKYIKEKNFQQCGVFTSNMFLAEDRILCFELIAKKNHNYILRYVNEAKAETDAPERIDEFVLQRRRWLNGSMFAATYAIFHWTKIWRSNHSLMRKLFLQLEFYYQLITILVSWFSLASFFLVFRILTANLGSKEMNFQIGKYLAIIFLWIYVGSVVVTFVLAFGNTPRGTKKFYLVIAIFFAVLMCYMMFAAIFLAVHTITSILNQHKDEFTASMIFTNSKFRDLIVSTVSTYILYFIGSFMYGEPSFMLTSFIQYVALSPTYINVLNIYAFCNIHDVSWGTKGVEMAKNLGSAKSFGKNKDSIIMVSIPNSNEEMDEKYKEQLELLKTKSIEETVSNSNIKKSKDDSYYAFVRTLTVLVWMLTNAILIVIVLNVAGLDVFTNKQEVNSDGSISGNSEIFLTIILWIVAGLAAFRFIGSFLFLVFKNFRPLKWKLRERKIRNNSLA